MKHIFALIVLIGSFIATTAFANSHTKETEFVGNYFCKGHDPFTNKDYSGKSTFTRAGDTYKLTWDLGKNMEYHGTGILVSNGTVSWMYANDSNPSEMGVGYYKVNSNGSLTGVWTESGKTELATETCTKVK